MQGLLLLFLFFGKATELQRHVHDQCSQRAGNAKYRLDTKEASL